MICLASHIYAAVQNSVSAGAANVSVFIIENTAIDNYKIVVADNGRGMPPEILANCTSPFYNYGKGKKMRMGLSLFKYTAEKCGGSFTVRSELGFGTVICADMPRSHIDRLPLGNISLCIANALRLNPNLKLIYEHSVDSRRFYFDSQTARFQAENVADFAEQYILKEESAVSPESRISVLVYPYAVEV